MSLSDTFDTSQIGRWASRQLADYDACNPGTVFAERLVLDESQAYALQSAVAELRCRRGERMIGYKVGCTSPTIRTTRNRPLCQRQVIRLGTTSVGSGAVAHEIRTPGH